jgi:hypothetical protein
VKLWRTEDLQEGARACEETIEKRRKCSEPVTGDIGTLIIEDLVVGDKIWL